MTILKTNLEESTQIALIQLSLTQIQKDIGGLVSDIKEIRNQKYVTQNEMQNAIKVAFDVMSKDINSIKNILWLIFSTFAVVIIGAVARVILKV